MIDVKPHRRWLGLLAAAVLLLGVGLPLLSGFTDAAQKDSEHLKEDRAKAEQTLKQMRDDVALAGRGGNPMTASDIERLLAPVDRLQVMTQLEHQAAAYRLTHFTTTLSPERTSGFDPALAVSTITLAADATLDTDAYAFIDKLRASLPGRAELQHLTLERADASGALSTDAIHLTAVFEWLSNGAAKTVAGAR